MDDVSGLRIGIPRDYMGEGLDGEVKEAVLRAADVLKARGASVEMFDLGLVKYAIPAYYTIAGGGSKLEPGTVRRCKIRYRTADYDGLHDMYKRTRSEGFGARGQAQDHARSFVLSSGYYDAYYLKALRVKALIKQAFDRAFEKFDVILGPARRRRQRRNLEKA